MRANADLLEMTVKGKADVFFAYSRGSMFGFGTISIWFLALSPTHSCSHERRAVAAA